MLCYCRYIDYRKKIKLTCLSTQDDRVMQDDVLIWYTKRRSR